MWIDNQHFGPQTQSDTFVWNVLEDQSVAVFNGNIDIDENGTLTEAYQHNKTLLLSEKARVHTMPKLEISTDDVKCSHGASISTLDQEQLFYLRSRGLPVDVAERIMIHAFSFPVLSELPVRHLREKYLLKEDA
jgi:Fe-S cluster assembly protein SufD